MASIMEAQNKIESFFLNDLKKNGVVREVSRTDRGWKGLFETLEINELLLEKGHEVIDRIVYQVELDETLNPTGYGVYRGETEGET